METITLVKDHKKRQFSPKAAKIAIEHFGWSEITTPAKPSEVGTKTKPPIIDKPVILKVPQAEKIEEVIPKSDAVIPAVDSGNVGTANTDLKPKTEEPVVKKPRKSPVKSKSKAK